MSLKKSEVMDILLKAKTQLNYEDYVKIWGEQLGKHIWFQEGSDLVRIWGSGLSQENKDKFIDYIFNKREYK